MSKESELIIVNSLIVAVLFLLFFFLMKPMHKPLLPKPSPVVTEKALPDMLLVREGNFLLAGVAEVPPQICYGQYHGDINCKDSIAAPEIP